MSILTITKENFKTKVIASDKPVLVDFWASWCGPCRMIAPVLEEIAGEQDRVKIVKVNVDDCAEIAAAYGVMSIPTLILFKNGEPSGQIVGVQSKNTIVSMMQK